MPRPHTETQTGALRASMPVYDMMMSEMLVVIINARGRTDGGRPLDQRKRRSVLHFERLGNRQRNRSDRCLSPSTASSQC